MSKLEESKLEKVKARKMSKLEESITRKGKS